jgi:hypothetical protein
LVAAARDAAAPAGFASDLASLAAGKAGGSAATSASATTRSAAEAARVRGEASSSSQRELDAGSFRERAADDATGQEVDAFLGRNAEAADPLRAGRAVDDRQHPWAAEFVRDGAPVSESGVPASDHRLDTWRDEPHEDHNDGEAVRQLLSDPSFVAMTDVYDVEEPLAADDLFPSNFTAEEQQAVDKIRSDLAPPPVHRPVPMDGPMNLLPDFNLVSSHDGMEADPIDMDLLQSATTRDQLLNEWSSVLRSYTDDVWGDLLPTIHEVREELEEAKRGGILNDKALARLRMVLNHVRNQPLQ